MVSVELRDIFHKVVRPDVAAKAVKWLETSSINEQKGLRIISVIAQTRGQRKFKRRERADWFGGRSKNATDELTRRALKSTYDMEYQGAGQQPQPRAVLFSYRKLTDLSYAALLTDETVEAVQKWLDLGDDEAYRQLVLECVRSIAAALANSMSKKISEARKQYTWKSSQLKSAPPVSHRPVQLKPELLPGPTPRVDPEKRTSTPIQPNFLTAEDMKKMKQALILGHRNLGRWIVAPEKNLSNYQEDYVPYFTRPPARLVMDFHTSISLGKMCPDISPLNVSNIL